MISKLLTVAGISVLISQPLIIWAQTPVPSTPGSSDAPPVTNTPPPTETAPVATPPPFNKQPDSPSSQAASDALKKVLATPVKHSSNEVGEEEARRRAHLLTRCEQSIEDGDRALNAGNYDVAAVDFQDAVDSVTESGRSEELYIRASQGLARAKEGQSQAAAKDTKFAEAADLLKQAVALDPQNPTYPAEIETLKAEQRYYEKQVRDPEGYTSANPALTDEFKDRVAAAQRLLFQGEAYFRTGQYELAEETFSKVLLLDPYNKTARAQMDHIEKYRERAAQNRHETEEQTRLLEVDQGWETKISPDLVVKVADEQRKTDTSNRAKISEKLTTIHLDHVSFSRAPVGQVITFLNAKTRDLDPDHTGVNFVLRLTANVLPTPPPTGGVAPAPGTITAPSAPSQTSREVSVNLDDISVLNFLQIVVNQTGLQFTIDDYAVYLRPSVDEGEFLNVRTYQAPPGLFDGSALTTPPDTSAGGAGGGPGATVKSVGLDVKTILTNKGVPFPDGSSAIYLAGSSKLVVRNTPENLDLVSTLIDQLSIESPEITIEAKIAEFNMTAIKGFTPNYILGFGNDLVGGGFPETGAIQAQSALRNSLFQGVGNGGLQQNSIDSLIQANLANNGTGVPTYSYSGNEEQQNIPTSLFLGGTVDNRGYGVILNLINNMTGVSLLSAPIVTTENNQEAKIEISQEFPYPTTFALPALPRAALAVYLNNFDTFFGIYDPVTLGIPSTPSAFKTQNLGVLLDVKPSTNPDQRIDLEIIKAEVVDFDGFIDYGEPIIGRGTLNNPTNEGSVLTPSTINQPVFNDRSIATKLQVLDGQTAILGGLTREDTQEINDKIPLFGDLPIIGRAFQSRVSQRIKKNLIFFITADLVRPNGHPQYLRTLTAEPEEIVTPPDLGPGITIPASTDNSGS